MVIFYGKTIPNEKVTPLGSISTTSKFFYLIGSYSSDSNEVKQFICKSTTSCSFHIVRVDQGQASHVVENSHSMDVRVRSEAYDHSNHISEKGYLYAFSLSSEDQSLFTKTGWTAINSENIVFEGSNFKIYRKKIHDASSILTTEYEIDPKNIWSGIKKLEKLGSREIIKLTKKVYCENCKVAFPNTIYGLFFFYIKILNFLFQDKLNSMALISVRIQKINGEQHSIRLFRKALMSKNAERRKKNF